MSSPLNKLVDKVYIINLDKDVERMAKMDAQMKTLGIEYKRFSAINGANIVHNKYLSEFCNVFCTNGMKGCALSHLYIWQDMVQNKYSNVCIFEDDAVLLDNFNESIQNNWKQLPKDYNLLYLGCGFSCTDKDIIPTISHTILNTKPEVIDRNIIRVSGSIGSHAYIITNKCANIFVNLPIITHIDLQMGIWAADFKMNSYSFNPLIVTTSGNEITGGSSLAESFPYILNKILYNISISNNITIGWVMNENSMKIGPININGILIYLFLFILLIPTKDYWFPFAWLLLEFLYSFDLNNTAKIATVFGIAAGLKFLVLHKVFPISQLLTKNIFGNRRT